MSEKRSSSGALSGHSPKKFKGNLRHTHNVEAPPLNIMQQLAVLWLELNRGRKIGNKVLPLRRTSFLLEHLVSRAGLNTLIVNLYPGNKGFSLAWRRPCVGGASTHTEEESQAWVYEWAELLEGLEKEEVPRVCREFVAARCPHLYYQGHLVAEIRDYRPSFPVLKCDTWHVLLRPTNQTLAADVQVLGMDGGGATVECRWKEVVTLESQLVLATAPPLCLDPDPQIGVRTCNAQARRFMWHQRALHRKMKKFSQTAVNRKRRTDQFTLQPGLELSDFLLRYRSRAKNTSGCAASARRTVNCFTLPRRPRDAVQPMRTPFLEFPTLATPTMAGCAAATQLARVYDRAKETRDCVPVLIEEYVLETDQGNNRVYHIKLSIYQRPSNSEFLGELYVDRDHRQGERNGESCQFGLGTRHHANRYIQQFTEIFTEEGRKSVKITHIVPGLAPKITCTAGMKDHKFLLQHQQKQRELRQKHLMSQISLMQPPLVAAHQLQTQLIVCPAEPIVKESPPPVKLEIKDLEAEQPPLVMPPLVRATTPPPPLELQKDAQINALAASFRAEANNFQAAAAAAAALQLGKSNATIKSLLNSAPPPMTQPLLKPAGKGLRMEAELKEIHAEATPSIANLKFALAGQQNLQVQISTQQLIAQTMPSIVRVGVAPPTKVFAPHLSAINNILKQRHLRPAELSAVFAEVDSGATTQGGEE